MRPPANELHVLDHDSLMQPQPKASSTFAGACADAGAHAGASVAALAATAKFLQAFDPFQSFSSVPPVSPGEQDPLRAVCRMY